MLCVSLAVAAQTLAELGEAIHPAEQTNTKETIPAILYSSAGIVLVHNPLALAPPHHHHHPPPGQVLAMPEVVAPCTNEAQLNPC